MCISLRSGRDQGGFSLAEVMISLGLTSLVLLGLAAVSLNTTTSLASMTNYLELTEQNRLAAGLIARDLRRCVGLSAYTTNGMVLTNLDGTLINYAYNANQQTFTRTQSGASQVLLEGCAFIEILIKQRNPMGGGYDIYPAADVSTCKVVKLNWSCQKALSGRFTNTENMTTGYIVIRGQ